MKLDDCILWIVMPLLGCGLVLAFVRLLLGPNLPDRVVALDLFTSLLVGMIVALAIHNEQRELVDVALILALVTFIGTIAFARYVEIRRWTGTKS
jgi:multicomponent Na+:H+ antiporter subunit F